MVRIFPLQSFLLFAVVSAVFFSSAVTSADVPPTPTVVLVLPFQTPADMKDQWIGKAVQQDLFTDLAQGTATRVVAPAGAAAAVDAASALQAAHDQRASIVVYGQAQAAGNQVRLSGQVIDVATGKTLGGLKSTGAADDLFHLEDALAGQVFQALPRDLLNAQTLQGVQQSAAGPAQQPVVPARPPDAANVYANAGDSNPAEVYSPQYYSDPSYSTNYYATPDTSSYSPPYTYAYPDADWWPYWNSGLIIGGFGYGGYHHDHWGDHHWGGNAGVSHFAPVRSGFSIPGSARGRSSASISSGGFHGGISRGASVGGFHGASGGGFHAGAGGFHGGGGHR